MAITHCFIQSKDGVHVAFSHDLFGTLCGHWFKPDGSPDPRGVDDYVADPDDRFVHIAHSTVTCAACCDFIAIARRITTTLPRPAAYDPGPPPQFLTYYDCIKSGDGHTHLTFFPYSTLCGWEFGPDGKAVPPFPADESIEPFRTVPETTISCPDCVQIIAIMKSLRTDPVEASFESGDRLV